MPDHANGDRSTSGLLLGIAAALGCVALLIAVSAFATRQTTQDRPVAAQPPVPTTTMAPVQPSNEAVTPESASSGVAPAWVDRTSQATGIGTVAVEAYGAVTLRMGRDQPGCRLGWTTLAGVGGVESGHGTNEGSALLPDGTTSRKILGPALDGTDGTAAIRSDARSVRWHGDDRWDHAMGPMQFIPSTWETWESDGNDDGVADPHNIYDAAYATGRYLCASGADLTTGSGWTQAVFSYNHSDDYVRSVLATANRYAALSGS